MRQLHARSFTLVAALVLAACAASADRYSSRPSSFSTTGNATDTASTGSVASGGGQAETTMGRARQ